MDRPLPVLLVQTLLNGLNLLQSDGFTGFPLEDQKPQRTDLKFFRIRVVEFRRRRQFTTQGMFHNSLECDPPPGCDSLDLGEEIIVQFQGRFPVWVTIWFYGSLSIKLHKPNENRD